MSEQIPEDPERQEGGGVEGAIADLDVDDESEDVQGGASPQPAPKQQPGD
jgi:hypothetical protein